jgi:hypothetical protein
MGTTTRFHSLVWHRKTVEEADVVIDIDIE